MALFRALDLLVRRERKKGGPKEVYIDGLRYFLLSYVKISNSCKQHMT